MTLMARGDNPAARRELERVLALDPGEAEAPVDLAVLDLADGDFAAAVRRFEGLGEAAAAAPRARFYHAVALDQQGRRVEAEDRLSALAGAGRGKYQDKARDYLAAARQGSD
jgi:Flp pilus assembly protein TadD